MERQLTIINKLGLHARASAKFVGVVKKYKAKVMVEKQGRQAPGDSLMALMTLCVNKGSEIILRAEGPDAADVLDALEALIQARFGEGE